LGVLDFDHIKGRMLIEFYVLEVYERNMNLIT